VLRASLGTPHQLFGASVVADANMYFCGPQCDVDQHFDRVAKLAGKPPGTLPRYLLTNSAQQHLAGFEDLIADGVVHSTHVFDLKHRAGFSKKTNEKLSCFLRGSKVWNHARQRGMLPGEQLFSMGYPYPAVSAGSQRLAGPYPNPLVGLFTRPNSLSSADWTDLAGNGLHVCVAGVALLWGLAHVQVQSSVQPEEQAHSSVQPGEDSDRVIKGRAARFCRQPATLRQSLLEGSAPPGRSRGPGMGCSTAAWGAAQQHPCVLPPAQ